MRQLTLEYVAGFFDGEGCVSLCKRHTRGVKPVYCLWVNICNSDRELLECIQKTYGGSLVKKKKCKEHYSQTYSLVMSNLKALKFLQAIEPYCFTKIEQVRLAIEWQLKYSKMMLGFNADVQKEKYATYLEGSNEYALKIKKEKHEYSNRKTVLSPI